MTAMVKDQKTEDNFRSLISLKLLEIFKEFFLQLIQNDGFEKSFEKKCS